MLYNDLIVFTKIVTEKENNMKFAMDDLITETFRLDKIARLYCDKKIKDFFSYDFSSYEEYEKKRAEYENFFSHSTLLENVEIFEEIKFLSIIPEKYKGYEDRYKFCSRSIKRNKIHPKFEKFSGHFDEEFGPCDEKRSFKHSLIEMAKLMNTAPEISQFDENKPVFPTLYAMSKKGKILQWTIFVEDNHFFTVEGQEGGKLTQSANTFAYGMNIGKKNETTPTKQAFLVAFSKFKKKYEEGFREKHEMLTDAPYFQPMLAQEYDKYKKFLFKNNVRVFIQPKLDGVRAISEKNSLMSRDGKAYVSCPHLLQNQFLFDGELYSHDFKDDFNKIISLCRKTKPTEKDFESSKENIFYFAYDFPEYMGTFSERFEALKKALETLNNPSYKLVETHEVHSFEEIEQYHEKFIEQGYEGTMVRMDIFPYEKDTRAKQLLKKKDFKDSEYEILDVIEGEGGRSGKIGSLLLKLSDTQTFNSSVKGTHEYITQLWENRNELIGKLATVKYFQLTPDGVPRFPVVIKIS